MNSENIKKVTAQAIEQLVEALNAGHSEALTRYLGAIAKFRAYSFLNVLLILKQCPDAGRVAGYKTWQSLGRQVKQGEKGIMILAPMFRKLAERKDETAESEESRHVAGFRSVYVWDEQQTTGNELPHIGSITGDPSIYFERLEAFVRASGLELAYSDAIAPAKGMAEKGRITLLPRQSAAETFATLVHEVAHRPLWRGREAALSESGVCANDGVPHPERVRCRAPTTSRVIAFREAPRLHRRGAFVFLGSPEQATEWAVFCLVCTPTYRPDL